MIPRALLMIVATLGLSLAIAPSSLQASSHGAEGQPHIGYGIHVTPWTRLDPSVVTGLGTDWVKIYNSEQAADYPGQRALYRLDVRGVPLNIDDNFDDSMRRLAAQLSRHGVRAVEIGNEPNLGEEWGNTPPNASAYVRVLQIAYRAFKDVAPHITVVSAGLAPTPGTADGLNVDDLVFTQQMFDAGAADYFDAFGYHPYGFDKPPEADPLSSELVFRRAERVYSLLLENGVREKQVWLTEFGWLRDPAEFGQNCTGRDGFDRFAWMTHSAETQAAYTVRAYQFADTNWPWAGPMFLWNLDWNIDGNFSGSVCSHLRLFSILDTNANPFPTYFAFQGMPKRYVDYNAPSITSVSAVVNSLFEDTDDESGGRANGLTRTIEAGCTGLVRLGSFTIFTRGTPNTFSVSVEAVNGPGVPRAWTSTRTAVNGSVISVFVDSRDVPPGLYQIVTNLSADTEQRLSSYAVRGWLLVHFSTSSLCISDNPLGVPNL